MNDPEHFLPTLRARLAVLLETLGAAVADRVPGVVWRAEMPRSRIYDLVALLTFARVGDPETELVALSLELREGSWTLDVTDRESLPLMGHLTPRDDGADIDMSSVGAASAGIETLLREWRERIVSELQL